jgi:hypothetical protein
MNCFIKKIFLENCDEQVHRQFVRFGKGTFAGRAALSLQKGEKIKLGGSFEFANDFSSLVSELADCRFSGIILSKEDVSDSLLIDDSEMDIGKKSGLNTYTASDISSHTILAISNKVYTMLLDAEGEGISLKMKKRLPKPGKSGEAKIDDRFCILEADIKFWPQIRDFFMLPDCNKKCKISHIYSISEIIMPKGEKDFAKIREMAKRKGKIIRKMEVDGKEEISEREFEA